jgi:hypothetical protein
MHWRASCLARPSENGRSRGGRDSGGATVRATLAADGGGRVAHARAGAGYGRARGLGTVDLRPAALPISPAGHLRLTDGAARASPLRPPGGRDHNALVGSGGRVTLHPELSERSNIRARNRGQHWPASRIEPPPLSRDSRKVDHRSDSPERAPRLGKAVCHRLGEASAPPKRAPFPYMRPAEASAPPRQAPRPLASAGRR